MAWLMVESAGLVDAPLVRWTPETIEQILKSNAAALAPFAHLKPGDPNYMDFPAGIPVPKPSKPYEASIDELHGPLPDALMSTIVNDRIRSAVEAIEPGVHQFIPTTIIMPDKSRDASWWTMRACHRVDAIALEYCIDVFKYNPKPEYPEYFCYRSNNRSSRKIAVYKDRISGMAMWDDIRWPGTFFSEYLGQYFLNQGIRGYALRPEENLNCSMHVLEV